MLAEVPGEASPRRSRATLIAALLGLALFVYFVGRVGTGQIVAALTQIAYGFPLIVVLSGARQVSRSLAWMRALDGHRLRLSDALPAVITGDALGNLTPLGLLVGEPAKCILVRDQVPLLPSLSALTIENFFYSLSAALTIALGAVLLLLTFQLPFDLRLASIGLLGCMTALLFAAFWVVRREWAVASGSLAWVARLGLGGQQIERWHKVAAALERRVYGFSRRNPEAVPQIVALELVYHVFGMAEVYVTLWLLTGTLPSLLDSFILESVNRAVNVVFRFVPLRLGVDEAGTALFTNVLQLGTTVGVTLAIVRKGRVLFWTGVGVLLLVRRGLTVGRLMQEAERAAAQAGS